uniref:Uncharacterized protein n=1 Tax=Anguilla anguilla TaxID=7936 RepID=A0A0E9SYP5_ANGAN
MIKTHTEVLKKSHDYSIYARSRLRKQRIHLLSVGLSQQINQTYPVDAIK